MAFDVPVTRDIIGRLDAWVAELVAPHLPAVRVADAGSDFHWELSHRDASVVQVAKAVRMVSGIRAALHLADVGFTTESASILRMVSDYHHEILALSEGMAEGRFTKSQQKFIDQFFAPPPNTPEEFEKQERERFVGREDLFAAQRRMTEKTDVDSDELFRLARFINMGYDTYVHGGYLTAMELYRGDERRFMLSGNEFTRGRCVSLVAVASKLHEVVAALEMMALIRGFDRLKSEIRDARRRFEATDEQSMEPCRAIDGRAAAL